MKKKIFLRGLLGIPLGIAQGYIITILISLIHADGYYSSCVPDLVVTMGSEIKAVIFQTALSGLLGAVFAASSVIWEMEDWSMVKQTGLYFIITALAMMPVAYFAKWMEPTFRGFVSYFGIFLVVFIVIWSIQYFFWKSRIDKMNEELKTKRKQ
ncbi:MAG TPA: DUF3021 domain-containing protein [Erysipelotrichaceae bacterium]|nr:DUF3021 domain-containing protein [Erysipelotrichaceae bacterium]